MYDLLSIGDIIIDLFFKGDSLTEEKGRLHLAVGGKYFVDQFHESLGGGGANVAVGVAKFNLNTAVCGKVGENIFKQIIVQKLIQKQVSTEFLLNEKTYTNISSIYLTHSGDKTVVNYQTPQNSFEIPALFSQTIKKSKWVYMGNLPSISLENKESLIKMFKPDSQIILNFGSLDCKKGKKYLDCIIDLADVLILNTHEYSVMMGKEMCDIDFTQDLGTTCIGNEKILVLTDGEKGSYAYKNGEVFFEKAHKAKVVVDTTGAGDAYSSAFIAGLMRGKSIQESMHDGAQFASEIVSIIGAQ